MPSPITITGTLKDLSGQPNSGQLKITLCNFGANVPLVVGTQIFAVVTIAAPAGQDGTFSANLWGNDVIIPAGTYYQFDIFSSDNKLISSAAYQIDGSGPYNLASLTPLINCPVAPRLSPILANVGSTQTISGGLTVTGSLSTINPPVASSEVTNKLYVDSLVQSYISVSASAAVQPLLAALTANFSDQNMLVLSDSTAYDYPDAITGAPTVARWVWYLINTIAPRFPEYTVMYRNVIDPNGNWAAWQTIQTGVGGNTLWVHNASYPGMPPQNHLGPNFASLVTINPKLVLIAHGHNMGFVDGTWIPDMLALTESVSLSMPQASILIVAQNPEAAVCMYPNCTTMPRKSLAFRWVAEKCGYGFIDVTQAFVDYGPTWSSSLINATSNGIPGAALDGVHENTVGAQYWASIVAPAFTYSRNAPTYTSHGSALRNTGVQLLANGNFAVFTGSVPTGWTTGGSTVCSKDTADGHWRNPNGYSVKLTSVNTTGDIWQGLPLKQILRQWITCTAGVYVDNGTVNVTNVALTSNVVTVDCINNYSAGQSTTITGLTAASWLNSHALTVLTASGTQFTAAYTHADYASTPDSGVAARAQVYAGGITLFSTIADKITNVALTSNVVTVTVPNTYTVGKVVTPTSLVNASWLNNHALTVLTASSTQFTAAYTHADYASAADTGSSTWGQSSSTSNYTVDPARGSGGLVTRVVSLYVDPRAISVTVNLYADSGNTNMWASFDYVSCTLGQLPALPQWALGGMAGFDPTDSTITLGEVGNAAQRLRINAADAVQKTISYQSNGLDRWIFSCDGTAESGADAGSNFSVSPRKDNGSGIDTITTWTRAAGGYLNWYRSLVINQNGTTNYGIIIRRNSDVTPVGNLLTLQTGGSGLLFNIDANGNVVTNGTLTATTLTLMASNGQITSGNTMLDLNSEAGAANPVRINRLGGTGGMQVFAGSTTTINLFISDAGVVTHRAAISPTVAGAATCGTAALPYSSAYIGGAATNNIRITGTATAARTWTLQDASDTFVGRATTDSLTNKTLDATCSVAAAAVSGNITGTAAGITGKATPTGVIVGDTDTQTLKSKTLVGAGFTNTVTLIPVAEGAHQGPLTAVTGTGADVAMYTLTVPANTLAAGKGMRIRFGYAKATGTNSLVCRVKIGSTNVYSFTHGTANAGGMVSVEIWNNAGVQNAQHVYATCQTPTTQILYSTSAFDMTAQQVITFTQAVTSPDTVTPEFATLEMIQ